MAYSINSTPLLQDVDTESGDESVENGLPGDPLQKPLFRASEPRDNYHMGYLIFYLLGIATLLPWNFYVTANDVSTFYNITVD